MNSFSSAAAFDNQVMCWDVQETLEQGVFKSPLKMVHRLERFSNTVLCMKVGDGVGWHWSTVLFLYPGFRTFVTCSTKFCTNLKLQAKNPPEGLGTRLAMHA